MNWFKKIGWLYMPNNFMGVLITFFAFIFMIPIVLTIVRNGHSVSDDLYKIFLFGTCTFFWWKWIAEKTSQ